jgi:hypothetical protein
VATERREHDRRRKERRKPPSSSIDVTRIEHENLYGQVEQILRSLRRIENELRALDRRVKPAE